MSNPVYKTIDLVGTSNISWKDAAKMAIDVAAKTIHGLQVAEIKDVDMKVRDGKVVTYWARVAISFKLDD